MTGGTSARRRAPGTMTSGPATVSPWTPEQLAVFTAALDADIVRLRDELARETADLANIIDGSDEVGDDQADAGSRTFEHEQELGLRANTRDMLDQAVRAQGRLAAGTYGLCERCGQPIAEKRLRAQPRVTLCLACKQAEERR